MVSLLNDESSTIIFFILQHELHELHEPQTAPGRRRSVASGSEAMKAINSRDSRCLVKPLSPIR